MNTVHNNENHHDNDNVNHHDNDNENHHDNDNENHFEIERIVISEAMFGTEFLNAKKHEFTYDNNAVDKINDSTSAKWKLDLNDLDWLSIKERGNELYKLKDYEKARFAYLLASRKCNDDRNKAICLGNLSAVYYTQKHYKAVIKACDDCLELNPDYLKIMMRRCKANEIMGNLKKSHDDAWWLQLLKYPDIDETVLRLKLKIEEDNRLQGLKLLKENKVQFDLILTFNQREQQFIDPFITSADISEIDWIRKIFVFELSAEEVKDLVKISSCQHNAEHISHLPFLAARNGCYYFNDDSNDDIDTAYWNDFRNSFLEVYKGPCPCFYSVEQYERVFGYADAREFFSKCNVDFDSFNWAEGFIQGFSR